MTTDITELAKREKFEAWAEHACAAPWGYLKKRRTTEGYSEQIYTCMWTAWKAAGAELVEALEKAQRANAAQDDHINQQQDRIESLEKKNAELGKYAGKLETINAAAEKLVRCKGRYHSELNYRALAAMFGVTTPDLPPLDGESRTVTVKQYDEFQICHYGATEDYAKGYIDCQNNFFKWLTAAGIKWEAE